MSDTEIPAPGDPDIDAALAALESADADDLDGQIDAADRLHALLTERLSGEA
jgi:hypothetical protein